MKLQFPSSSCFVSLCLLLAMNLPALARPIQAEDLKGLTYQRRPGSEGKAINTVNLWQGLPPGASLGSGWLLTIPGNIGSPQSFGVHLITIAQQQFLSFELISNFADGTTFTRILDAHNLNHSTVFFPCSVAGSPDPTAIALLTPDEQVIIEQQQPNQMDDKPATIDQPSTVIRLDTKALAIIPLDSEQVSCRGYPVE